ncbi:DUF1778 domain-containing protein [Marinobacter sp.]|uniref:type II toxin -antitoxin system TacA 1-like antitoxin n=1 Tax=Marinobacter sp. TaxID=50741 RepID=UPI00384DA12E
MKLSLDVSPNQYECLKSAAELEGKTLSSYVLERALAATVANPSQDGDTAAEALFSHGRERFDTGGRSSQSVEEIFNDTMGQAGS